MLSDSEVVEYQRDELIRDAQQNFAACDFDSMTNESLQELLDTLEKAENTLVLKTNGRGNV